MMVEMKDSNKSNKNTLNVSPIEENVENGAIGLEDKLIKWCHSNKINVLNEQIWHKRILANQVNTKQIMDK